MKLLKMSIVGSVLLINLMLFFLIVIGRVFLDQIFKINLCFKNFYFYSFLNLLFHVEEKPQN